MLAPRSASIVEIVVEALNFNYKFVIAIDIQIMEEYDVLERIGGGDNTEVLKMRRRADSALVVCKKISYAAMDSKEKHQLVEEVNILRELKSNHIVKYY